MDQILLMKIEFIDMRNTRAYIFFISAAVICCHDINYGIFFEDDDNYSYTWEWIWFAKDSWDDCYAEKIKRLCIIKLYSII